MLRTIYVSIYASIDSESNVYQVRVERRKNSAFAGAARAQFFAAAAGASTARPAKTGYYDVVNAFLMRRALRFCWRCSNMVDECFNVAQKMREYYYIFLAMLRF